MRILEWNHNVCKIIEILPSVMQVSVTVSTDVEITLSVGRMRICNQAV